MSSAVIFWISLTTLVSPANLLLAIEVRQGNLPPARTRVAYKKPAQCYGYGQGGRQVMLSTKPSLGVGPEVYWLPTLDSI